MRLQKSRDFSLLTPRTACMIPAERHGHSLVEEGGGAGDLVVEVIE
jgi:hypothetical protein